MIEGVLVAVGSVRKTHGYAGEVKLAVEEGFEELVEGAEFLFIGRSPTAALPYEVIQLRGSDFIVSLAAIENREAAVPLRGQNVYIMRDEDFEAPAPSPDSGGASRHLLGFALIDVERGELGAIDDIEEDEHQAVAYIMYKGREVAVPLAKDFIKGVDFTKKIVFVELPEGLLEL